MADRAGLDGVEGLDGLVARLEAIDEELADAAVEALRDAVEAGDTTRPEAERRISQARRGVQRAIACLRQPLQEL